MCHTSFLAAYTWPCVLIRTDQHAHTSHTQPHWLATVVITDNSITNWTTSQCVTHTHTLHLIQYQTMLRLKDLLHLSMAYGNFEGLGKKIEEKCPSKYTDNQAFSVSKDNYMIPNGIATIM